VAGRPPFPSLTADGDDARHPFLSLDGRHGGGSLDGRRLTRRRDMSWCCSVGVAACPGGDSGGSSLVLGPAVVALSLFCVFLKIFAVRVNRAHGKQDLTSCRERATIRYLFFVVRC
jgi:hypothetical protein